MSAKSQTVRVCVLRSSRNTLRVRDVRDCARAVEDVSTRAVRARGMTHSLGPSYPMPSSPGARSRMLLVKRHGTAPELAIRRQLHLMGFRYRVDCRPDEAIRRRADVVFRRERVAVFIDGCFWHSCPIHCVRPSANAEWWRQKLARNARRDRDTSEKLEILGWRVLRFWEHEAANSVVRR